MSVEDGGLWEIERGVDPDGVTRLALVGELDLAVVDGLSRCLEELRASGQRVRIDLSRLEFIDSSGIRLLVAAVTDARRDGWALEVDRKVTPHVERVIKVLGVDSVLWPEGEG